MLITKEAQSLAETESWFLPLMSLFVILRFGCTVLSEKGHSGNKVIQKVK